jgi:hypothetical protein
MSDETTPGAAVSGGQPTFFARMRATFGPALVGLAGGGATVFLLIPTMTAVLDNMALTLEKFPSEPKPWFVGHWAPSSAQYILGGVLGCVLPVFTGWVVVRVARPRDSWETISAGITAALASTLASFAAYFGWMIAIAMVVVPVIQDLSLVCESATPPPGAEVTSPAETLAIIHPDLQDVPQAERNKSMFPRLITNLAAGSATAIWVGLFESACLVGTVAFLGTLSAGYLLRLPGQRFLSTVGPYLELTVPPTLAINVVVAKVLLADYETATWSQVMAVIALTAVLIFVARQRGQWLIRLALALVWMLFLARASGVSPLWVGEVVVYGVAPILLGLHYVHRKQQAGQTIPSPAIA